MTWAYLIERLLKTFRDPRGGARWVLSHDLPIRTCWEILLLVTVVSTAIAVGAEAIGAAEPVLVFGVAGESFTLFLGLINLVALFLAALLIYSIGAAAGGKGDLKGAVLLVAWLQSVLIFLQLVQFLAVLVLPPLAGLIGIFALVMLFWLPTNFIAELHGFQSLPAVFASIFFASFVLLLIVSVILTVLGMELVVGPGV